MAQPVNGLSDLPPPPAFCSIHPEEWSQFLDAFGSDRYRLDEPPAKKRRVSDNSAQSVHNRSQELIPILKVELSTVRPLREYTYEDVSS
jgi:hypothetical protein